LGLREVQGQQKRTQKSVKSKKRGTMRRGIPFNTQRKEKMGRMRK